MSGYVLSPHAGQQLDAIYEYTAAHWGEDQAERYIATLFQYFSDVAATNVLWRAVPAEFGVDGFFGKCQHHFVYWKVAKCGDVAFVAILHERMHQIQQMREIGTQPM